MAKIKLGQRPPNFKKVVKFQMLDGSQGSIEAVYKYRTRAEFGAFVDGLVEEAKRQGETERAAREDAAGGADAVVGAGMGRLMNDRAQANADYIMQVMEGWNLDEAFNPASVLQLCDELPAAATALIETYREAVTEGRLGN